MICVVPLAGPDFVSKEGQIKAMTPFMDSFLLKTILQSRIWSHEISKYYFVFQDSPALKDFYNNIVKSWFPNSSAAFITQPTQGAAMSVMASLSMIADFNEPVIVDLADIYYESQLNVNALFNSQNNVGGISLFFESHEPCYSYLKFGTDINSFECREKEVISNNASAGTYIFKNLPTLVYSLYFSIENFDQLCYNNLLYICPALNALKKLNLRVIGSLVSNVIDVKTSF